MNLTPISRKILTGMATGALALGLVIVNVTPAYAQDGPTSTPPAELTRPEIRQQRLERLYERAVNWSEGQTDNLSRADEAAATTQTYIDEKKAAGLDTSALEAALASYKTQIAEARVFHDQAVVVLNTHNGFDDAGKVTDVPAARLTLADAGSALGQARVRIHNATFTLRQAVRDFRDANGLTVEP